MTPIANTAEDNRPGPEHSGILDAHGLAQNIGLGQSSRDIWARDKAGIGVEQKGASQRLKEATKMDIGVW